ncbi:MAG: hypothetical protein ACYDIA_07830, partial [Candidatus Humimicrobiaceae bacterium]
MSSKKANNTRKIIILFLAVLLILAFALTGCKKAAGTTTVSKIDVGQETSTSDEGSQTTETTKAISKLQ